MSLQACNDPLDRKRAVHLLRRVAPAAATQPLAHLMTLYEALDDFALFVVQVCRLADRLTFLRQCW